MLMVRRLDYIVTMLSLVVFSGTSTKDITIETFYSTTPTPGKPAKRKPGSNVCKLPNIIF
jgi:hypothetical protein